jgi:hypothetical protein
MRCPILLLSGLAALAVGCARSRQPAVGSHSEAERAAPAHDERPRYGAVMGEIGRRFELAGRAAVAARFELAAFEVGELQEAFAQDLPRAELPQEGPTAGLPAMAAAFLRAQPAALQHAAADKNLQQFSEAFRAASVACNGCHQASGHGFIEIPSQPGKDVPDLEPVPASKP